MPDAAVTPRLLASVAVVDWDQVTLMPRGLEILRCLTYAGLLDPPRLETYLRGYGERTRLTAAECTNAVELWWRLNLHETWLFRSRLDAGDTSVQQFFAEQTELFTRFADRAFRAHLAGELQRLAGQPV